MDKFFLPSKTLRLSNDKNAVQLVFCDYVGGVMFFPAVESRWVANSWLTGSTLQRFHNRLG